MHEFVAAADNLTNADVRRDLHCAEIHCGDLNRRDVHRATSAADARRHVVAQRHAHQVSVTSQRDPNNIATELAALKRRR